MSKKDGVEQPPLKLERVAGREKLLACSLDCMKKLAMLGRPIDTAEYRTVISPVTFETVLKETEDQSKEIMI